ncbi:MAG: hypothetical protein HND48_07155 [Chloroflexi bacterium]|nr:hypothetical protein [Chloroflexota bacterium]
MNGADGRRCIRPDDDLFDRVRAALQDVDVRLDFGLRRQFRIFTVYLDQTGEERTLALDTVGALLAQFGVNRPVFLADERLDFTLAIDHQPQGRCFGRDPPTTGRAPFSHSSSDT